MAVGSTLEMFYDNGSWYPGKVAAFDARSKVYTVVFEDGDVQETLIPHPDVRIPVRSQRGQGPKRVRRGGKEGSGRLDGGRTREGGQRETGSAAAEAGEEEAPAEKSEGEGASRRKRKVRNGPEPPSGPLPGGGAARGDQETKEAPKVSNRPPLERAGGGPRRGGLPKQEAGEAAPLLVDAAPGGHGGWQGGAGGAGGEGGGEGGTPAPPRRDVDVVGAVADEAVKKKVKLSAVPSHGRKEGVGREEEGTERTGKNGRNAGKVQERAGRRRPGSEEEGEEEVHEWLLPGRTCAVLDEGEWWNARILEVDTAVQPQVARIRLLGTSQIMMIGLDSGRLRRLRADEADEAVPTLQDGMVVDGYSNFLLPLLEEGLDSHIHLGCKVTALTVDTVAANRGVLGAEGKWEGEGNRCKEGVETQVAGAVGARHGSGGGGGGRWWRGSGARLLGQWLRQSAIHQDESGCWRVWREGG